jgi:DNA-binding IclR family transcriptional regulator
VAKRIATGRGRARQGIQSIEVGSTLLEVLSRAKSPLSLSDLSRQANMSASKAHRYLVSLLRTGLVLQDPVTNRYDVGALSLKLGLAALNRTDLVRFGIEAASWLNRELDTTVLLCVWGTFGPTVVAMYNSTDLMIQNVSVGAVLPLTRSATGRVFLAYMPRRTTAQQVRQELKAPLAQTPISRIRTLDDVEEMIKKVRKQRLGTTQGDVVPGQSALAAPVFDHEGRIVLALTLIGASDKVDMTVPDSPARTLLRTADLVSQRLGFWHDEGGAPYVELQEHHPDSLPYRARHESSTLVSLFPTAKRSSQ